MAKIVAFTIDGKKCQAAAGTCLVAAAAENGVYIPTLCNYPGIPPKGACRICTVRIDGRLATACTSTGARGHGRPGHHARAGAVPCLGRGDPVCGRQPSLPVLREERKLRAAGAGLPLPHDRAALPLRLPQARRGGVASEDPEGSQPLHPLQEVHPRNPQRAGQDDLRLRQARRPAGHQHRSRDLARRERRPRAAGRRDVPRRGDPAQGEGIRRADRPQKIRSDARSDQTLPRREMAMAQKKIVATASLAGCFGCHMSLLDIDERILELVELVELNKSPHQRHQDASRSTATSASSKAAAATTRTSTP